MKISGAKEFFQRINLPNIPENLAGSNLTALLILFALLRTAHRN
jgi:hypothetical protein